MKYGVSLLPLPAVVKYFLQVGRKIFHFGSGCSFLPDVVQWGHLSEGGDSFAAVQAFGSMQGLIRTGRHGA